MITNIVCSNDLFLKNVWSVQFFLPQQEIETNNNFQLVKIEELIYERKENITLTEKEESVNYIGLENIEAKTGRIVSFFPKQGGEVKSTCKKFYKGDILYGRLRPNLNKVYFNSQFEEGVCTTEIIVMTPVLDKINPIYFSELLRTEMINKRIVGLIKGAALPRVAISDLKQLALPIPSLKMQNEFAEEIQRKRIDLEEHIRIAQQIPLEIDNYITSAFIG